jgi:predicted amidophosphoribosyltransferase
MPETARVYRRMEREAKTVRLMIELFCRGRHEHADGLCDDCVALLTYVQERLTRCPFRIDKPTCLRCAVHCFKPGMRERIRVVMRYAGPHMAWRHPVRSLLHSLDSRAAPRSGETP